MYNIFNYYYLINFMTSPIYLINSGSLQGILLCFVDKNEIKTTQKSLEKTL